MPHRIQPGWRYSLAQFLLSLIFCRKWHFISPWYMAGVGCAVSMISPDGKRALLQRRAGAIEGAGKWGTFGGYLEPQRGETFAGGLVRELWEESGIHIDPRNFESSPQWITLSHKQEKIEMWEHTGVGVWFFRTVPDDMITHLHTSTEVSDYKWVTLEELDAMWQRGEISGTENSHYMGLKRAFLAVPLGLPPLDLTPPQA